MLHFFLQNFAILKSDVFLQILHFFRKLISVNCKKKCGGGVVGEPPKAPPNVSRIRGVKAPKAPWNRLHGLPRLVESFRARDTIEKDEKILCLSGSVPNDRIRMRDPHRFIDNTKLSFYTMSWATPSEILGSLVRCEIAQAALIAREIIQKND